METELRSERDRYTNESTISDFYFEADFECNLLEDTMRNRDKNKDGILQASEKVYGQTAIPPGRYEIKMCYSNHFKRKMPHLHSDQVGCTGEEKPGQTFLFSNIMIHWANYTSQLLGCLATGKSDPDRPDVVWASQDAYNKFEKRLLASLALGRVYLTIFGGYPS